MNYGYDSASKGWIESKKEELAERLRLLCNCYPDDFGRFPYVEVDSLYSGVRIRRITHLPEANMNDLVAKADEIYNEIMEIDDGNIL